MNIPLLLEDGAEVQAWDPVGEANFQKRIQGNIRYCETIGEALEGADLCMIFTEWEEVQKLDVREYRERMRHAVVLDGRNCYGKEEIEVMKEAGVTYESIGR